MARIVRLQWMRNKEEGHEFGGQSEILPLTEEVFQREVKPRLRKGFARTLSEYQSKVPLVTHYELARLGDGPWRFVRVGPLMMFLQDPNVRKYAKVVKSFDSPEALEWGRTADSDVYGLER